MSRRLPSWSEVTEPVAVLLDWMLILLVPEDTFALSIFFPIFTVPTDTAELSVKVTLLAFGFR